MKTTLLTRSTRRRESLLLAIARAQSRMESIISGARRSLDEIAVEEQLAERYIRRLAQLAFLSPKIVEAIATRESA